MHGPPHRIIEDPTQSERSMQTASIVNARVGGGSLGTRAEEGSNVALGLQLRACQRGVLPPVPPPPLQLAVELPLRPVIARRVRASRPEIVQSPRPLARIAAAHQVLGLVAGAGVVVRGIDAAAAAERSHGLAEDQPRVSVELRAAQECLDFVRACDGRMGGN